MSATFERVMAIASRTATQEDVDRFLNGVKADAWSEAAEYVGRNLYDNKTYSELMLATAKELRGEV